MNVLAIATLCGMSLAACTATKPPPAPPDAPRAKSAAAQPAPKAKPEPVKPPEAPPKKAAAEVAPKTPVVPKAPAQPATAAAPKKEAAVAPRTGTVAKAPTAAKAPAAAPAAAPAPAAKPAPLDLKTLEQRLKESDAIGVMTKLSLKNQVDDLVGKFRAYHGGERPPTLPQLRPAFELLLMKVLSLLQDKDPRLAHDIDASREAIWGVLSDRARFAQFL